MRIIKKEYNYTSKPISMAEIEFKAKDFVLKKRINYLFVIEKNGNTQPLEAGIRIIIIIIIIIIVVLALLLLLLLLVIS